jgi:ATP-dependent helicase/nuclease subunit A
MGKPAYESGPIANGKPPTQLPRRGLTEQQAKAVDTRGASVVLSSGAGCGKTEVLTQRYLFYLRRDEAEVGQLAAITFTDRAARQMRRRIRKTIKEELAHAKSSADRERWARHLRNLETAVISTIHSFCTTLLRQHAIAAQLDPRFEVLEDVLSSSLREDSLRDALQELLTAESPAGDDLRELVPIYGWRVTNDAVQRLLAAPHVAAWDEWTRREPAAIAEEWMCIGRSELLSDYVRHLITAEPKVAGCLRLLRNTPCIGPIMRANVQTVLDETPRLAEAGDLAAAVKKVCEAAKVGKEREKAWPGKATYEIVRDAMTDFRAELPKKLALFTDPVEESGEAAVVAQRFIRVAAACDRVYQERKRSAGVVDFHDLLSMARDLLRDRSEVRAQVRHRIRFLLIDELQDTDPVQMELARLLCGPGLMNGTLFAVGDEKQSIYRFRGAEVELFRDLRRTVPSAGRQELSVNFRSQPQILHFANALFGRHISEYEPLTANRKQQSPGGCVEFLWSRAQEKRSVQQGRCDEAHRIARRIASMVGRGEQLIVEQATQELRPVRPGDVVLLFRSMSNVGLYEAALRQLGLDYYLVGGRAFFAQQEIYDLLNLLRALENPQDAVSLAGTLRSPFGCASDDALYLLARHPDGLWSGLHSDETLERLPADEKPAVNRVRRFLDRWRAQKDRLPIAGLINFVLADCGYDAALQFEFLGDRKLANLWKLIDLARTFDRSGLFGLPEFVARLGDLVQTQPREEQAATLPEKADVVRLMSIHQAKGLEFPVVVLPDLAARTGGSFPPAAVWDDRFGCVVRPPSEDVPPLFSRYGWALRQVREELADWNEAIRIFYVACTRAEDYLILSAGLPASFRPENPAMNVLAERFNLDTGECRDYSISPAERPVVRVTGPEEMLDDGGRKRAERPVPPPLTAADLDGVGPIPFVQSALQLCSDDRGFEGDDAYDLGSHEG